MAAHLKPQKAAFVVPSIQHIPRIGQAVTQMYRLFGQRAFPVEAGRIRGQ